MKELNPDMTNIELFMAGMKRAKNMGAEDMHDTIIALEDECREYRKKIKGLTEALAHKTGKPVYTEEGDTVITIHSEQKISSVDIYFQGDEDESDT